MKVYFASSFSSKKRGERPGRKLDMEAVFFQWGQKQWCVPAVYRCAKGLVVDLICEIDRQAAEAFYLKVKSLERAPVSEEEQRLLTSESPMDTHVRAELRINGKPSGSWQCCAEYWLPCRNEERKKRMQAHGEAQASDTIDSDVYAVLEAYHLDPDKCWGIARYSYHWTKTRSPRTLRSLEFTLAETTRIKRVLHYFDTKLGELDQVEKFNHPISAREHTLHIRSCTPDSLPDSMFEEMERRYELPRAFVQMQYVLEPPLNQKERLLVIDTAAGDQPRKKTLTESARERLGREEAGSVGLIKGGEESTAMIGGADGPIAMIFGNAKECIKTACSAIHFTVPEQVRWCIVGVEVPDSPQYTLSLPIQIKPRRKEAVDKKGSSQTEHVRRRQRRDKN